MPEHVPDLMAALDVSLNPAVTDPAECRRIGLAAYHAYMDDPKPYEPKPGDLVLELTTSFRWLGGAAPGEALGWLLRVENEDRGEYHKTFVLRPIFEPNGVEFRWANCKFIKAHLPEEGDHAA